MDNILKIVLGVVAFVGLIVLLLPEGNPLQDKGSAAVSEEGKNLPPPANPADDDEEDEDGRAPGEAPAPPPVTPTASSNVAFGQPMLDPTPPGMQNQQPQPQQNQNYETPEDDDRNTSGPAYPGVPNYGPQPGYQYSPAPPPPSYPN